MNNHENYVNFYKSLGFSIIPLVYRSKRPLVSWKEYQKRQPADAELACWFGGQPRNIGIVTGSISGNLTVLDFDDETSYHKFFPKYEELEKTTLAVKPSRGSHIYLRNDRPIQSLKLTELKLDVKAEGSFVVAPPSLHPCGHIYHFINPELKEVALVSDLENTIWRRAAEVGVMKRASTPPRLERRFIIPEASYRGTDPICIKAILKGVQHGLRDEAAIRLAQYFLIRSLKTEEALNRLIMWNKENIPPIGQYYDDPRNIERYFIDKIRSAEKTSHFGCTSLKEIAGICYGRDQCEFFRYRQRKKRRREKWSITICR